MTPRPLSPGAGLRGPAQDVFPEGAKQHARDIGLEEEAAQILKPERKDDGGGDSTTKWVPDGKPVDGRIDIVGRSAGDSRVVAEQVSESTTHIVTLEPSASISTDHRIEIEGKTWLITGENIRTDEPTVQVPVKELST